MIVYLPKSENVTAHRRRVVSGVLEAMAIYCDNDIVTRLSNHPATYGRICHLQYLCSLATNGSEETLPVIDRLMKELRKVTQVECLDPSELITTEQSQCEKVSDHRALSQVYIPRSLIPRETQAIGPDPFLLAFEWAYWRILQRFIGHVILLDNRGTSTHESYTISSLPCTVYLERSNDDVILNEALVHEAAHCQLNEHLSTLPTLPEAPLMWSPWKGCLRPPFAILHAVYAFSTVVHFLEWLSIRSCLLGEQRAYIHSRLSLERARLSDARASLDVVLPLLSDSQLAVAIQHRFDFSISSSFS